MGLILESQIAWTGFVGGPGYTVLHTRQSGIITSSVDNMVTAMQQFCTDIKGQVPNVVTLRASNEVKEIDEATGVLSTIYTSPVTTTNVTGTGGSTYAAPVGACISWSTGGVNRGRRVKGRSFIVPLVNGCYDVDGSLSGGCLTALNLAASNWRTSSAYETVIWSRPRLGAGGAAFDILGHRVADRAAVLRSRRA